MNDEVSLDGKAVVVTGAGNGIGRDLALALAGQGAAVVVNDIGASLAGEGGDAAPAEQVVAEIRAAGGRAVASFASVADYDGARSIVQAAIDAFGRVDGVVNNAGILRDGFFHKMSQADWDSVLKVHLYGGFNVSRAAIGHFRDQKSGAFVHMTSASGLIGNLAQANYSAAKLGLVALSKSIALDARAYGVRSNCVSPFAWSRMISAIKVDSEAQRARVERLQQMTPAKIAPLVGYLLSDAARDVTGQIFSVRNNEIFVFSQPRPLRSVHAGDGWTTETVASRAMPALRASFTPLDVSADVFSWDPV